LSVDKILPATPPTHCRHCGNAPLPA
jgi:hypothetical protein